MGATTATCTGSGTSVIRRSSVPTRAWVKVKVKSSMARSSPDKSLLPLIVLSIINYFQYAKLSCSRPQPATDNDVTDGRSN